jgi:hypothetical protein
MVRKWETDPQPVPNCMKDSWMQLPKSCALSCDNCVGEDERGRFRMNAQDVPYTFSHGPNFIGKSWRKEFARLLPLSILRESRLRTNAVEVFVLLR